MGETVASEIPNTATGWATLARAAVDLAVAVPAEELLLVRDANGRRFRPAGPPAGRSARLGAVLLLLYPEGNDVYLPLTIRSEQLASHRGEVALPGGATDPEDTGPTATALRECEEEVGVAASGLELWGTLTSVYIAPSNFQITPVVAWSPVAPQIQANPSEVSGVITVSLQALLDPATVVTERWTLRDVEVDVPFFAIANQKVWGATALVLSEFVARLRRSLGAV